MVQPSTVQINKTLVNSAQSTVCGVMTRAQTMRQEKPRKPLRVPKVIDATVSRADFRNAQHNDPSLARFIDKADVDFPEHSRNVLEQIFYPGVRSSSLILFVIFYAQYNIIYCLGLY